MRLFERLRRMIIENRRVRKSIEARRAKEARRKGAKPKLDRVDRYLAGSGAVHDEITAMRREVAMRY